MLHGLQNIIVAAWQLDLARLSHKFKMFSHMLSLVGDEIFRSRRGEATSKFWRIPFDGFLEF